MRQTYYELRDRFYWWLFSGVCPEPTPWARCKIAMERLSRCIGEELTPAIMEAAESISQFLNAVEQIGDLTES